jgi:serine/threonine-protein kinase HipA
VIDPNLRLVRGQQYAPTERDNFGLFLDSSPDRWGRVLLQRREARYAKEQNRPQRRLNELDYLLGVFDGHRLGGLRFRFEDGAFLDDNAELASPPWTSLRELEHASLKLERSPDSEDPDVAKWLQILIAPGRSLGGARPKASVLDPKRRLWIAKFPSADDRVNVGAWERVLHQLAARAGVTVPETTSRKLGSKHHTFLARRFDRTADMQRIHFASAMTLLEKRDGDPASYLEIASVITQGGAQPARDLEQLWRRIVFNMCTSNVDDHLRNHGFLLTPKGWVLAPVYDINPDADGNGLTLNVSETDNSQELELALSIASSFRIKRAHADVVIGEVRAAVRDWRAVAEATGISRDDRERMTPAFRLADGD